MNDSAGTDAAERDRELWEARLADGGQQHLLQFWDELTVPQRRVLVRQIEAIDLEQIRRLVRDCHEGQDWHVLADRAEAPEAFRLLESANRIARGEAVAAAEAALASGKVGLIVVAGGQGTRLGFDHPKGMFPLGPLSGRCLFQLHIDQLLAVSRRYRVRLPLYLMTSPATHDETVQFLSQHDRFGLPADDLHVFCQGTMPAVDDQGRLLLEDKGRVFLSPDGHGGMLSALARSGGLQAALERGIEQLFYFQVDNPLVRLCDRELIGYHLLAGSEMSTQVVAKRTSTDKVGNVVSVDGRLHVIEYSDLPAACGERRNADGTLRLWAGSIAIHVFRIDFLQRCAQSDASLPFHRARKKVAYVDTHGRRVSPAQPNATKFERFIFDLMPAARNAIVVEAEEREVFAPLKNASGAAHDTPEASRQAMIDRARRWLQSAGATVAPAVAVEIHPRFALDPDELKSRIQPGSTLREDTFLVSAEFADHG